MLSDPDNIITFPVPPTRLLRVLIDEARTAADQAAIAQRLVRHVDRTGEGTPCPWCRLPRTRVPEH